MRERVTLLCGFSLGLVLWAAAGKGVAAPGVTSLPSPRTEPAQTPETSSACQLCKLLVPERYTLSPEKRAKAVAYARLNYGLYFLAVGLSLGIYFLFWRAGIAELFRQWARRVSSRHFVQCIIFVPLFIVGVRLMEFPLHYYWGFVLERRFGLSTQGFASWLGDWGKDLAITTVLGITVIWILYWVVRRSPRLWWFYFWLIGIPLALGFILIEPYVIDPLFFNFAPLGRTRPALTARIEDVLQHAGLEVPRSHIFEMDASTKTKTLDAYVSGIGASKRVVVWDNTLRKLDEDETLLVLVMPRDGIDDRGAQEPQGGHYEEHDGQRRQVADRFDPDLWAQRLDDPVEGNKTQIEKSEDHKLDEGELLRDVVKDVVSHFVPKHQQGFILV